MRNCIHGAQARLTAAITQYRSDRRAMANHVAAWPMIFECLHALIIRLCYTELLHKDPNTVPLNIRLDGEIALTLCARAYAKRIKLKRSMHLSFDAVLQALAEYSDALTQEDIRARTRTRFKPRYPALNSAMPIPNDERLRKSFSSTGVDRSNPLLNWSGAVNQTACAHAC